MDMGVTEREGMSEEIQRPLWHANSEARGFDPHKYLPTAEGTLKRWPVMG